MRHSNQGIDTLKYGYMDYYAHILLDDNQDLHGEEGAEQHCLAHMFFQATEKLDEADGLLIRLANPGRAGRRRRRQHQRLHWVWKSIGDITHVVGTMQME